MNAPNGLVSVVMPVYGVEAYVADAIHSVLEQSWRNFELIVVDDCSPDGSGAAIAAFSDPRLKSIRFDANRGVAAARNAGLAAARGEFIALLDGDDLMHRTRLERQIDFMWRHPAIALCGGWCRTLGPQDEPPRIAKIELDPRAVNASLVFGNPFCTSTLMLRREAIPEGGFRQRYAEDYDFLVRVAARHPVSIVPQVFADYRIRPGSAMHTCALEKKKRDVWESQEPLFEALKVTPSAKEREIHLFARINGGNVDRDQLNAILRWYERLVRANRRTGLYDDQAFRLAASYMWFEQMYRATGCGTDALRLFFGNLLSFVHPQPLLRRAKFVAKALLSREFSPQHTALNDPRG